MSLNKTAVFLTSTRLGLKFGRRHFSTDTLGEHHLPVLTLFTKEDCSLCDDAKDVLRPYLHMVKFEEVDITDEGNKKFYMKYRYDIPVFHLNGKFLMKHRADIDILLEKLKSEKE